MGNSIQSDYEMRLSRYVSLIHGNDPPGLVAKLAVYSALQEQHDAHGDRLCKIEPLLPLLIQSVEVDLHLATTRLLEDAKRSDSSIFKFLNFCESNRTQIAWQVGPPPSKVLWRQIESLESHRETIIRMMGRRDKFFAHLDKKYFVKASEIYSDFPISSIAAIELVNCVIRIITEHQVCLNGKVGFHLAEMYTISVDNMIRNLEEGRRQNFPGQLD